MKVVAGGCLEACMVGPVMVVYPDNVIYRGVTIRDIPAVLEHLKGGEPVESLLGEELPAHARPTVAGALRVSAVWLVLWLVPVAALLATLVLIFAFQAENITTKPLHVALIAVPILIQVYFNSSLTYGLMRLFKVEYAVAAPGALIGASNFFELAVATAIALFGPESGAALATVVGVLIEVPVMLSVWLAAADRAQLPSAQ